MYVCAAVDSFVVLFALVLQLPSDVFLTRLFFVLIYLFVRLTSLRTHALSIQKRPVSIVLVVLQLLEAILLRIFLDCSSILVAVRNGLIRLSPFLSIRALLHSLGF